MVKKNELKKSDKEIQELSGCPFCGVKPISELHTVGVRMEKIRYFFHWGDDVPNWCPCKGPSAVHEEAWERRV